MWSFFSLLMTLTIRCATSDSMEPGLGSHGACGSKACLQTPCHPTSPHAHLSIRALVSQSSAPAGLSQQNQAHPHIPCPPPTESQSPPQRPKHSSMSPVQKPTPNQRRAFVHITGPQQPPADLTLWPLLPGRGVQGEGGEGTGEEPGVPELDFTLSHLQ